MRGQSSQFQSILNRCQIQNFCVGESKNQASERKPKIPFRPKKDAIIHCPHHIRIAVFALLGCSTGACWKGTATIVRLLHQTIALISSDGPTRTNWSVPNFTATGFMEFNTSTCRLSTVSMHSIHIFFGKSEESVMKYGRGTKHSFETLSQAIGEI